MPSRQNVKKIVTPVEIQGDDAYVVIKNITIDEAKKLQELSISIDKKLQPERNRLFEEYAKANDKDVKELTNGEKTIALANSISVKEAEKFFYQYYSDYVMDWNWVTENIDESGNPVPMNKPHGNPDVFGTLTAQEFGYIQSLFQEDSKSEKN